MHETSLITTIAAAIVLAFALGLFASKLRIPPLVGYLLAGVVIGPFTPGFVGDTALAGQLAEIGIMLLMFGVGLHFSVHDLLDVRDIAVPGAVAQILTATLIGAGIAALWGWSLPAGLVFGLSLSVASTVVLLRALEERRELQTPEGRIAVGWLVVEDLAMVLALVLLPALAGMASVPTTPASSESAATGLFATLGVALAKVVLFVALALVVGTRAVPWLLMQVARTGSRELFTLAVLAIALGIAYGSAASFGVSFALGAFFAGVILSESDLSHKAGEDSLPLRDAFAVLFFVSVGMLFDPTIVLREPLAVVAVLLIVLVGKSVAAFCIVLAFGHPLRTALTISASLAQIGEFSFILAGLGMSLGILPAPARDLILAGALLSIMLNPLAFAAVGWLERNLQRWAWLRALDRRATRPLEEPAPGPAMAGHAIVVGHGRVGSVLTAAFSARGLPFAVVERDARVCRELEARGIRCIRGDATAPGVLGAAGIAAAHLLVVALPESYQVRRVLEIAQSENPHIETVIRTHSRSELDYLRARTSGSVLLAEEELAHSMLRQVLDRLETNAVS